MNDQRRVLTVIAVLALAGVFVMLLSTPHGIGVLPDSTVYFDAARNLALGRGLVVISGTTSELIPLIHYPPLYSSLLAVALKGGITIETAARWLNAGLFGATIFLVGYAIAFSVGKSFWLPVLGSMLTLTATDVLAIHSVAMTEPLYLALTLIGLLLMGGYLQKGRRSLLVMAAILIALSCLTRYVGLATIASAAICIMLLERTENAGVRFAFSFHGETFRRRMLDTVIFVVLGGLPVVIWSIRSRLAGNVPDRHLAFHPVKFQQIVSLFSTVAQWLLLGKVPASIRVIGFLAQILIFGGLGVYLLRQMRVPEMPNNERPAAAVPQILMLFVVVYILFLIFTASFIDADTVFDSRSLLPVHVAGIILLLCIARNFYERAGTLPSARSALVLMAVLLVASHSFRFVGWVVRTKKDGQGYASRMWTQSETIAAVKPLAPEVPMYSNGYDAIYYLTGRPALLIPEKVIHGTGRPNLNYDREMEEMKRNISEYNGVLVYFHNLTERSYLPSEDELRIRLSPQVRSFSDGSILETHQK